MSDFPTLATLEGLLEAVRERASDSDRAVMEEALKLCATARTVHAGVDLNLQGALALIRSGNAAEAAALIEQAVEIGRHWHSVGPTGQHQVALSTTAVGG